MCQTQAAGAGIQGSTLDSKQSELMNTTHSLQPDPAHSALREQGPAGLWEDFLGQKGQRWGWASGAQSEPSTCARANNTDIQMATDTLPSAFPAVISFQPPNNAVNLAFCFSHFIDENKNQASERGSDLSKIIEQIGVGLDTFWPCFLCPFLFST